MTRPTPSSHPRSHGLVPRFRYGHTDQHIRVSDAERAEVADRLAEHFAAGRLDQAEFDERAAQATNAKTRGDLRRLFHDLPEPGPPVDSGGSVRSPVPALRPAVHPFALILLVVAITAAGTAGEAVFGHVAGLKTWLMVGIITAIVVYAAGMLNRSRAARDK